MMAPALALPLAALAAVASGANLYMAIDRFTDASCTEVKAPGRTEVYDYLNIEMAPPDVGALKAFASMCIPSEGRYMHIEDCMLNTYTESTCTSSPVSSEPLDVSGCHDGGEDGEYVTTTCMTEVPPLPGVVDLTCWTALPTAEMMGSEPPACSETCWQQDQPDTCAAAHMIFRDCLVGCTESDLEVVERSMQYGLGCACELGGAGGNGTSTYTCGDIKDAYKANACCGMPDKHFSMPPRHGERRRLSAGSMTWGRRPPSKVPKVLPRNLPAVTLKDSDLVPNSVARHLARARARGGPGRARDLAAKINALLGPYLAGGAVQV